MIKKNRLLGLFFICLSAGLFAQTSELKADTYLPGDTILIASEPDYPPFCFVDENNNAAGFSIDLFNAAAEAVGLKVRTKIGVWTHIRQELESGSIDALPLVGRTPEREALYDFSIPYLSLHGAVFVRKGTRDIHSLQDLKNKDILVMEGDNAEEFARREQISEHIHTTNTFEEAFRLLSAGEFDAVITQRVMGLKLLETIGVNNVEPLNFQIPGFRQDFCFAVQKGNAALLTHLNEGLSIIIANGTYAEIRSEWFGPADQLKLSMKQIIRFSLYIIIPMIFAGGLGGVIFLRREIKKKDRPPFAGDRRT
jgi:ABC-type amino acid transport substrate-binding protein